MANGASQAELRSERLWKRRLLLSNPKPPLRRVGALPIVVIDLEDDDSLPDSDKIDARGNGLAIECEIIGNEYCDEDVIKTRKGFGVVEKRNGNVNHDCLSRNRQVDLDYKFFLDSFGEEGKDCALKIEVGDKAAPLVIDHGICSVIGKDKMGSRNGDAERHNSRVIKGKNAKCTKGKEKMGSRGEEVPCCSRRNSSDVMEVRNARLDHDGDAERHNSKAMKGKNAKCTKGKSFEVMEGMDSRLGRDGDSAKGNREDGDVGVYFIADSYATTKGGGDSQDRCVSNADDARQHCPSGDDVDVFVLDTGHVNYYSLSDDDDTNNSCDSVSDSDGMVDECYKIFLCCLKPDGEIADFMEFNGEMKRYGAKSNKKERPRLNTPFNSFTPRNNDDIGRTLTSTVAKQTKFVDKHKYREGLINALKRPYNQNEHEKLWSEITTRRPIEQDRELRGTTKRYLVDRVGKSYLDHHPDLASTITSMKKDKQRVLNQLRGFFYWLENLTQQGSFVPWKDPVCLQVLPNT